MQLYVLSDAFVYIYFKNAPPLPKTVIENVNNSHSFCAYILHSKQYYNCTDMIQYKDFNKSFSPK